LYIVLTFDDDGVIRFVDAAADRADGKNKKMNGRGEEKRKMSKSGHSRRRVKESGARLNLLREPRSFYFVIANVEKTPFPYFKCLFFTKRIQLKKMRKI
jgi:hypothetical protein